MSAQEASHSSIPKWAWIFAIACFLIPVLTMGGAIPAAIGGLSGFGVFTIARQEANPLRKRVVLCGVVTGSAWTVFVAFLLALAALPEQHPATAKQDSSPIQSQAGNLVANQTDPLDASPHEAELTEEKRRKIYMMAMQTQHHLEFARANGASADHLARLKAMQEGRLDFTARFYKITRAELDDIIAEGQKNHWPTE